MRNPAFKLLAFLLLCAGFSLPGRAAESKFTLASPTRSARICVPASELECVRLAAQDLAGDAAKITGVTPKVVAADGGDVLIVSLNRPASAALLEKQFPGFARELAGKWEAYRIETVGGRLVIAGSDERGTMFGIYHFIEEMLGVDPLYYWSGLEPEKRDTLAWETVKLSAGEPTFRFRGWFINDEDLLTEWMEGGGKRNIQYPYYSQTVNPKIMRAVAESLVRSRCNMIIPASFIDILNPPEKVLLDECARRGVFLTQHHIEPMGVNAFAYFNYWKNRGKDLKYSYFSQRDEVLEVWRAYATEWAKFPNVIWQTGLRGIGDRPMWMADEDTPQSDADRGALISDAMAEQMKILNEVCPRGPKFTSTTLWAEGSVLNQKGHLTLPENMTVVFADNSPGWKWQADFYSTPRNPKNTYGVYYHHQLIGSGPHLAQVPSPNQTYQAMKIAVEHQASEYAVMNVGNIREFVLNIDAHLDATRKTLAAAEETLSKQSK